MFGMTGHELSALATSAAVQRNQDRVENILAREINGTDVETGL